MAKTFLQGATIGCCTGILFVTWIAISSFVVPIDDSQWKPFPLSVSDCIYPDGNSTSSTTSPLMETTIAETLVVEEAM